MDKNLRWTRTILVTSFLLVGEPLLFLYVRLISTAAGLPLSTTYYPTTTDQFYLFVIAILWTWMLTAPAHKTGG